MGLNSLETEEDGCHVLFSAFNSEAAPESTVQKNTKNVFHFVERFTVFGGHIWQKLVLSLFCAKQVKQQIFVSVLRITLNRSF